MICFSAVSVYVTLCSWRVKTWALCSRMLTSPPQWSKWSLAVSRTMVGEMLLTPLDQFFIVTCNDNHAIQSLLCCIYCSKLHCTLSCCEIQFHAKLSYALMGCVVLLCRIILFAMQVNVALRSSSSCCMSRSQKSFFAVLLPRLV